MVETLTNNEEENVQDGPRSWFLASYFVVY